MPSGVVVPRTVEAAARAVAACAEHGVPVISRGGGTSMAGQACNAAVVIDWSNYCHASITTTTSSGLTRVTVRFTGCRVCCAGVPSLLPAVPDLVKFTVGIGVTPRQCFPLGLPGATVPLR